MRYNFKFLQTGGVPLTNDLMSLIEEAYGIFEVLGDLSGNLTILSGCDITGTNVTPGIVAIEGKLYYFEGGSIVSTVYIHKEDIQKTFEDQTTKTLIEKRTVRFGSGAVNYNWADFVKLKTLKEIQSKVDNSVSQDDFDALVTRVEVLEMKTAPIINGGVVWAWFKPVAEIPAGWKECIDIRGKVIVGLDPNDVDFSTLKGTIGAKKHTLTLAEMPSHSHRTPTFANGSASGNAVGHPDNWIDNNRKVESDYVGGNQPHNNIQPSIIAYFIEPNLP
ncbi:phage baseplate protein [Chryseobacterium sp. KCF3-3]|uniref:phage baseplate protein n=1 Tax=Chryseobacterium sp. KCF3-3 TaxID=3231511 RepID=UPI0038B3B0C2